MSRGRWTKERGSGNMSVLIGHAASSENGTINGAARDSTGKEVCTRTWYSKPWNFMAVHPDAGVRERHALAVEAACRNDNIGYGQNDRNTLNALAKRVNYDLSRVGKCNCDCSSLQNVAAVASGAAGVTYGSNGWTTYTMKTALQNAGYKIITERAYLGNAEYCVRGAIYVNTSTHTVAGLTNGSLAARTLSKAGIGTVEVAGKKSDDQIAQEVIAGKWGNGSDRMNQLRAEGYDADAIQNLVNQKLGVKATSGGKSVEQLAREVWAGEWGIGQDRVNRLRAAGYDADAVQRTVNKMYG